MIILTGGAGMIGSLIAWHLNTYLNVTDIVIVDELNDSLKEKNFAKRKILEFVEKENLFDYLKDQKKIDAIIHMGAISSTTESNFNKLLFDNIRCSQKLWSFCAEKKIPFIYASSAATYGGGENGYEDFSKLNELSPLNAYGYSKHFFDCWVESQVLTKQKIPPQWCGLKFFNVYGPNEYHKGRMASVVLHAFNQFQKENEIRLFKSMHPKYKDGMQLRDFIYVKDAVKCVMYLLNNNQINGLFNIGTGKAQTFYNLAEAVVKNLNVTNSVIKFIAMPLDLENKYQYFTQANINKLREANYKDNFMNLEQGVTDYLQNYLLKKDRHA